jgi:cellulose synthase/poly-beta-1,6-N-acetylglucosamine synthase-like glycosyltransferase
MKLGLSSYLMGNGMCFSRKFLQECGWNAFTVGEDWEFYTKIIQVGKTVAFSNKARVYHQESSSLKQATTQRMRWSSGRFEIARKYGFRLFFQGLREGDIIKIDGSLPLLFPNPSLGMNLTLIGLIISIVVLFASGNNSFAFWYISLFVLQLVIFVAGILYTKNKIMKLLSLFVAPIFLTWKLGIDAFSLLGFGTKKWIRTERKASS